MMTNIDQIQHDINTIRQEFRNLEINQSAQIRELNTKMDRLMILLEGDNADKDRGFIPRMIAIEKFVSGMKDTKTYLMGNIAATVFIITALGGIIAFAIKVYHFFKGN